MTAAMNSIVKTAEKMKIPLAVHGAMGMAGLYKKKSGVSHWRNARDLDIEIPRDVPSEKIRQLFEKAGLSQLENLPARYFQGAMISKNPYSGGRGNITVLVSRFCPDSKLFAKHTKRITYENHVIHAYNLPSITFNQFTPEMLIASKALALADPNRAVAIGKMDDIHDLVHVLRALRKSERPKILNAALRSGFWGNIDMEQLRSNLSTVLDIFENQHAGYSKWLANNSFHALSAIAESDWRNRIGEIRKAFNASGYSPLLAIRTKVQLADETELTKLAAAMQSKEGRDGNRLRSGFLARELEEKLSEKGIGENELDEISRMESERMIKKITKILKKNRTRNLK